MGIVKAVFDTNILIDYLNGHAQAKHAIENHKPNPAISVITSMEVLVGVRSLTQEREVKNFLSNFVTYELNTQIADLAVSIRRNSRIKLPDAIIWGTAKAYNSLLVTRNTKDFSGDEPDVKIPYTI